jgi:uncharacterized protein
MVALLERAQRVVVLDHHKTSMDEMDKIPANPKLDSDFDMERSGATVTWDWFHPCKPRTIVRYAEDHDLWRFALPHSKEIRQWLCMWDYSIEQWDEAAEILENPDSSEAATQTGVALVKFQRGRCLRAGHG